MMGSKFNNWGQYFYIKATEDEMKESTNVFASIGGIKHFIDINDNPEERIAEIKEELGWT